MSAHSAPARWSRRCPCCTPPAASPPLPLSRRNFLSGGTAALGLGAAAIAVGSPAVLAQPNARTRAGARRIDVHHHFLPSFYFEAVAASRTGTRPPDWSPALSLEDMDKSGTSTAILSLIQPGVWTGDIEKSRRLARECNEYGARLVSDHAGRFGLWAAIPLPDVDGSLREIEYALDVLKADGIGLMTSIDGKYLGDKAFAPVLDELNRRKAVVYTHPLAPNCCTNVVPGVSAGTIEYATDTTRTIASILFTGTAARCPDIRFIFSHSGGTLPFLVARFVRQAETQKYPFLPNGPIPELQKFYYEIAQGNTPGQLAALLKLAPLARLMFGTDYPFRNGAEAVDGITSYGFNAADLQSIDRDTALRLLPRLKT
ncbi:MAG: amidohydrolase family protein [Xanthobacteraceae bacterium]